MRQMRGRKVSRCRLYRAFSIRAPLLERSSKARRAWRTLARKRTSVGHRAPHAEACWHCDHDWHSRGVPPTGAGAAITADTGTTYTHSGAGAGVKYPSTGAGAQNTADAGAMYSYIGAGAKITADAGAMAIMAGARAMCSSAGWRHDYDEAGVMCPSTGAGVQNTAVASAMCSSTGVGVAITADADTMCSYTGAGAGITADTGATYTSSGAGAQYTASAGATGVLLPVKVPSVYDLAHTTTP